MAVFKAIQFQTGVICYDFDQLNEFCILQGTFLQ